MQETFQTRMFAAARQARNAPTQAERALWEMVRDHRCGGLGFRRQVMRGPFRVDFYCPAARLAIEIDGGSHANPAAQARDTQRQAALENDFGICFLRLSNDDVLRRPKQTLQRIVEIAGLDVTSPSPCPDGEGCAKRGVGSSSNNG